MEIDLRFSKLGVLFFSTKVSDPSYLIYLLTHSLFLAFLSDKRFTIHFAEVILILEMQPSFIALSRRPLSLL